jgi:hypothetical protein
MNKKEEGNISKSSGKVEPEEGFIVWLGDDGIVRVKINRHWIDHNDELLKNSEMRDKELERIFKNVLEKIPPKSKIFVNIESVPPSTISSGKQYYIYRKNTAKFIKKAVNNIEAKKIAICGGGIVQRVGISFILIVSGLHNIRIFPTEKEALKWLKEE